jgi:hypothetical protein
METATGQYINTPKLQNLLVWVEQVTDATAGDFQPVGKRAIANAYAYAIDKFIDYAQKSERFQIYKDLDSTQIIGKLKQLKEQIPRNEERSNVFRDFSKQIIQTWLAAFHLTPEMIDLSESELTALDNYFYANLLMVQCKEAAVRVSTKTWSEIESRMLLPPRNQN